MLVLLIKLIVLSPRGSWLITVVAVFPVILRVNIRVGESALRIPILLVSCKYVIPIRVGVLPVFEVIEVIILY